MRIEQARDNVFTVTATSQELSALVAAARMALNAMRSAPEPPPPEALDSLERVLADFDSQPYERGLHPWRCCVKPLLGVQRGSSSTSGISREVRSLYRPQGGL